MGRFSCAWVFPHLGWRTRGPRHCQAPPLRISTPNLAGPNGFPTPDRPCWGQREPDTDRKLEEDEVEPFWTWSLLILLAVFAVSLLIKWVAERVDEQNGLA